MNRFNSIMEIIGGAVAIPLGLMFLAWTGEAFLGLAFFVCGIAGLIVGIISFRQASARAREAKQQQQAYYQGQGQPTPQAVQPQAMAQQFAPQPPYQPTPQPVAKEIVVIVDPELRNGSFSVHLNGQFVGNIRCGEALRFGSYSEANLLQVGKPNGKPFNWPESCCTFNASQTPNPVQVTVTHKNLVIMLAMG